MIETADVPTAHGAKYMQQLLKHWSHKLETHLDGDAGSVLFDAALARFAAGPAALAVTLEAETAEVLERMKSVLATHLDRFAFREAPLAFDWKVAA
ncbi:DUF2218 domain-containing protein [Sphingomonas parva]|uniref:DUF2218 domain-containing protein n=1 Tax=Sphingomonas parva TaxID=2555898 RepID=A0A4Y8ZNI1_9SPHN|nr:DUF2218 domain-containing protein [Sphingomonas parva]